MNRLSERLSEKEQAAHKLETAKALQRLYETSSDFNKVITALLQEKALELLYTLSEATSKGEDEKRIVQAKLDAIAFMKTLLQEILLDGDIAEADLKAFYETEIENEEDF